MLLKNAESESVGQKGVETYCKVIKYYIKQQNTEFDLDELNNNEISSALEESNGRKPHTRTGEGIRAPHEDRWGGTALFFGTA